MRRHKITIRFLVFWHIFIAAFALLLYVTRTNTRGSHGGEFIYSLKWYDYFDWYGINAYLILIAVVAFVSGICLIMKKQWGRVLSILLGGMVIPFGTYILIYNIMLVGYNSNSFFETLTNYFTYMGATLGYIDLICILYGIFSIVYFTRTNVKSYLSQKQFSSH